VVVLVVLVVLVVVVVVLLLVLLLLVLLLRVPPFGCMLVCTCLWLPARGWLLVSA
jgi:hypothetical protein